MAQSLSYSQYILAHDAQVIGRVSSILKDEGISPVGSEPDVTSRRYISDIVAQPGLAESYHAALLNSIPNPGAADDVITDGALLAAVMAVVQTIQSSS